MGARRRRRICIGCELGPGVEYNYYDLGSERYGGLAGISGGPPLLAVDYTVDVRFSSVLARLSYKFGEPVVVAKY